MEGKNRFLRVYAGVPISLRKEIIFVDKKEGGDELPYGPVTWQTAYLEVMRGSDFGKRIVDRLVRMEII